MPLNGLLYIYCIKKKQKVQAIISGTSIALCVKKRYNAVNSNLYNGFVS